MKRCTNFIGSLVSFLLIVIGSLMKNILMLLILCLFLMVNADSIYAESASGVQNPEIVLIPGNGFEMGDHYDLGGAEHESDEVPIHSVRIDSFYMGVTEITTQQYCEYLSSALSQNLIEVRDGYVYAVGGDEIFCETREAVSYSRIGWDGNTCTVLENKGDHPITGVRWSGAAAYCNWLGSQSGYQELYNLSTGECDFS